MALHQVQLAFNSGELSPYLRYRNDVSKHGGGAELMRNFLPLPFGAFSKRPGLEWLEQTEVAGMNSKAFPFTASDGTQYVLHFTPELLTIYRKDGTVADTCAWLDGGEDYDPHAWPEDYSPEYSIRALQMVQLNDVAFFTHPSFFPMRLQSLADTDWELKFIPFDRAPMLDENTKRNKTYTVASDPVADTWASGEDYNPDDKVFTNCEWKCLAAHTAAGANKPGEGADWREFWVRMFYEDGDAITLLADDRSAVAWEYKYLSYLEGEVKRHWSSNSGDWVEGESYAAYCGLGFTASAGYDYFSQTSPSVPLVGADQWIEVYAWEICALSNAWWFGLGELAYRDGQIWKCILAHAPFGSDPEASPGTGVDHLLFWEAFAAMPATPGLFAISDTYSIGDKVARAGRQYTCILDHTPAAANRPGSGASWETYWVETSRMVEEFEQSAVAPGQYFRISPERDEQDFQIELQGIEDNDGLKSDYIVVQGAWNLFTYGTWWGIYDVQRSHNDGRSWATIASFQSNGDRNVAFQGIEDVPAYLRIKFTKIAAPSTDPETGETTDAATEGKQRAVLIPESAYVTGYCLMKNYVSADEMTGVAKTAMLSGNTYRWAEGAFSSKSGFPRTLCLHGAALWFASTVANPVSYWKSQIDDFTNFETGTEDDDGVFGTLATGSQEPIRWLAATRRLFMGTSLGEWVAGSETNDLPITPGNLQVREYTRAGSCPHQPVAVGDGLFFLGRMGTRLYELAANPANEGFANTDLSRLADHLTAAGISSMAYQGTREPVLWAVTTEGLLLSFNYSRPDQISAWARHDTEGGLFRDVVVFPSNTGDDEVFFIVDRGVDSHLECFPQGWQGTQEAGIAGPYVDGPDEEPITSELRMLPVDLMLKDGTTHGRVKRCHEILLNVFESFGGGISYDGETISFDYANSSDLMDSAPELRTEWLALTLSPAHLVDLQLAIVHSDPYPFTVRAVILRWQLHEA